MNILDLYDVIRNPIVTEKASFAAEKSQIVFRVAMTSTESQIKEAVEKIFSVKVKSVNTLIRKGKAKRFRGRQGVQSSVKRAIVTLEEGFSIDITSPQI